MTFSLKAQFHILNVGEVSKDLQSPCYAEISYNSIRKQLKWANLYKVNPIYVNHSATAVK